VLIDGIHKETISEFSSRIEWRSRVTYSGLTPGVHTITIRCIHSKSAESMQGSSGGFDVDVDGIQVK
jgi:hypothetical protein